MRASLCFKLSSLVFSLVLLALASGCGVLWGDSSGEAEIGTSVSEGPAPAVGQSEPVRVAEWYTLDGIAPSSPVDDSVPKPLNSDPEALRVELKDGQYLTRNVAACGSCHGAVTGDSAAGGRADQSAPLSGGQFLSDSYGEIRAPNITPDKDTGIGSWSPAEIMTAIRASIGKDSRPLSLDVHWSYRWMADQDARAIALYLLGQRPVKNEVERRDLGLFSRKKLGLVSRHQLVEGYVPKLPSTQVLAQYGRYLTLHVSGCGQCHSPERQTFTDTEALSGSDSRSERSVIGDVVGLAKLVVSPVTAVSTAGEDSEQDGNEVAVGLEEGKPKQISGGAPNIRAGKEGAIANWSAEQIVNYLDTGKTPSGEQRQLCPWEFYRGMSAKDKQSIAAYLKTL